MMMMIMLVIRYWKNMYGYRLGEDDCAGPNVYYHVTFGGGGSTVFTYPEWTVRYRGIFSGIFRILDGLIAQYCAESQYRYRYLIHCLSV
jgi:hypothetical protein